MLCRLDAKLGEYAGWKNRLDKSLISLSSRNTIPKVESRNEREHTNATDDNGRDPRVQ